MLEGVVGERDQRDWNKSLTETHEREVWTVHGDGTGEGHEPRTGGDRMGAEADTAGTVCFHGFLQPLKISTYKPKFQFE